MQKLKHPPLRDRINAWLYRQTQHMAPNIWTFFWVVLLIVVMSIVSCGDL